MGYLHLRLRPVDRSYAAGRSDRSKAFYSIPSTDGSSAFVFYVADEATSRPVADDGHGLGQKNALPAAQDTSFTAHFRMPPRPLAQTRMRDRNNSYGLDPFDRAPFLWVWANGGNALDNRSDTTGRQRRELDQSIGFPCILVGWPPTLSHPAAALGLNRFNAPC